MNKNEIKEILSQNINDLLVVFKNILNRNLVSKEELDKIKFLIDSICQIKDNNLFVWIHDFNEFVNYEYILNTSKYIEKIIMIDQISEQKGLIKEYVREIETRSEQILKDE